MQNRIEANSKAHAVLTFPGNLILSSERVSAATRVGIRTVYLYGSTTDCVSAFLSRERRNGRNLDLNHWRANNSISHKEMSSRSLMPYRIQVFTPNGIRRPHAEVFETLLNG
jgi:hypothetical protein